MINLETIDFNDPKGHAAYEDVISTMNDDCLISIFSYLTWRTQQEVKNVSRKMRSIVMNKSCRKRRPPRPAQTLEVERTLHYREQNFLYFVKHIPSDDQKYGLSYRLSSDGTEEKIVYPYHSNFVTSYDGIRNLLDKEALPQQILPVIKQLCEKYIFTSTFVFKNITIDRALFDYFKCKQCFPKHLIMHNVYFDGDTTPTELREAMRNSGVRVFVWEEGQPDFLTSFNLGFFQEFSRL